MKTEFKIHLTAKEIYLMEKAIDQLLYWDWVIQPDGLKGLKELRKKLRKAMK